MDILKGVVPKRERKRGGSEEKGKEKGAEEVREKERARGRRRGKWPSSNGGSRNILRAKLRRRPRESMCEDQTPRREWSPPAAAAIMDRFSFAVFDSRRK